MQLQIWREPQQLYSTQGKKMIQCEGLNKAVYKIMWIISMVIPNLSQKSINSIKKKKLIYSQQGN